MKGDANHLHPFTMVIEIRNQSSNPWLVIAVECALFNDGGANCWWMEPPNVKSQSDLWIHQLLLWATLHFSLAVTCWLINWSFGRSFWSFWITIVYLSFSSLSFFRLSFSFLSPTILPNRSPLFLLSKVIQSLRLLHHPIHIPESNPSQKVDRSTSKWVVVM